MSLVKKAQRDRYLVIDKKRDTITYLPQGKVRKLSYPEEEVQMEAFLKLIYKYKYPPQRVFVSEKIKMGSSSKEVDVMVYNDDDSKDPYIVVECKKKKISNKSFEEAVDQGFSYAAATNADYVWTTSGDKNAYFKVDDGSINERHKNRINRIPYYQEEAKFGQGIRKLFRFFGNHPIISDTALYVIILFLLTLLVSRLETAYHSEFYSVSRPLWEKYDLQFNWVYNLIVLIAVFISLAFGGVFMRSHEFFNTPTGKKRTTYFVIALILFLPAWYMGVTVRDPNWWTQWWSHGPWWTEANYSNIKPTNLIYMWPYILAIPFQFSLTYGLIWLMVRTKRKED